METRKTRVTLDYENIHLAYLFADDEISVAFERDEAESVMEELGVPYEFRECERESRWSSRIEKFTALVMEPGAENEHVIEPVSVASPEDGWLYRDAYPIDVEPLAKAQWKVVSDGRPFDILTYAEAAAIDIREHIEAIIDQYASGVSGVNTVDTFYAALEYLLQRREYVNDIPEFLHTQAHKAKDGYIFCAGCLELVPDEAFHEEKREETAVEQTHTDAGWGDDDMFGEVTRLNTYRICDTCGRETKVDSLYLRTRNEKSRWQLRSER